MEWELLLAFATAGAWGVVVLIDAYFSRFTAIVQLSILLNTFVVLYLVELHFLSLNYIPLAVIVFASIDLYLSFTSFASTLHVKVRHVEHWLMFIMAGQHLRKAQNNVQG